SSARTAANSSLAPSKRISTFATAHVMAPPARSSHGRGQTTIPTPADAAGQHSVPRAVSSDTSSSTKAMIQASSPSASDFFNGLLGLINRGGRRCSVFAARPQEFQNQRQAQRLPACLAKSAAQKRTRLFLPML